MGKLALVTRMAFSLYFGADNAPYLKCNPGSLTEGMHALCPFVCGDRVEVVETPVQPTRRISVFTLVLVWCEGRGFWWIPEDCLCPALQWKKKKL
jgi:hypothetical protein